MASDDINLPDLSEEASASGEASPPPPAVASEGQDSLDAAKRAPGLQPVFDVPVSVQAVIGRTRMEVSKLMGLKEGSVIELDRRVGEAIDIYVNSRLVARGEIVVVEDQLGVTMTEIITNGEQ